jgi:hypothetical protein
MLAGCGASTPDITVPTFPSPSAASGDAATFIVDGQTITIRQSGRATVSIGQAPQLDHSGPLGCKGRYFTGHLTEHIGILLRYTAREAWLFIGNGALYHFGPPKRSHGRLVWQRSSGGRRVAVIVSCPLPRAG